MHILRDAEDFNQRAGCNIREVLALGYGSATPRWSQEAATSVIRCLSTQRGVTALCFGPQGMQAAL